MKDAAYKALATLNAFVSVEATRFDVTFTDTLTARNFLKAVSRQPGRERTPPRLRPVAPGNDRQSHGLILRRRTSTRVGLAQLDDLKPEHARPCEHRAFMTLETSPDNFPTCVAFSDPEPDLAWRLRKRAGADPTASGATRIAGSRNFKPKYDPGFPMMEMTGSIADSCKPAPSFRQRGL